MRKILAFGHQKGVGKDEIVKFIIDILRPQMRGLKIVRRGFADKLYDFCHSVYGWAGFMPRVYYANNPSAKAIKLVPLGKSPRELLIELGNYLRQYDKDIWINANLKSTDYDVLLLTDLRYPNEFAAVQQLGGHLFRITRPGLPLPTDEADTALNGWESKWHLTLNNDRGLSELHKMAETLVKEYILG